MVFMDDAGVTFGGACLLAETLVSPFLLADALIAVFVVVVFPCADGRVMGWANVPRAQIGALVSPASLETAVLAGPAPFEVETVVCTGRTVLFVRFVCEEDWLDTDRVIVGLRQVVAVILGSIRVPDKVCCANGAFYLALASAPKDKARLRVAELSVLRRFPPFVEIRLRLLFID
jgi:hypothetical protein